MAVLVPALLVAAGVGVVTTAATLSLAPKFLGPADEPTPPSGICGAYWYRGYAIMPYELQQRRWGWVARGGNAVDLASHRQSADSRQTAIGAAKATIDQALPEGAMWQTGLYAPKNAAKARRVWGEGELPEEVEAYFCAKPSTNWIWVSPDCAKVVEGPYFEPLSLDLELDAELATSVKKALEVSGRNSVYGYIDWLFEHGTTDTVGIVSAIAKQLGCEPDWDALQANDGSDRWFWSLVERTNLYVQEAGGIPFDPLGST